jgi:hypothetical protein
VRDEVGFLALHQGFADRFFPGTSVLHTRLRYALFVPWLMEKVAAESNSDLARRLSAAETALVGQLRAGTDRNGIIGGRVWPRPTAQPPSMSYWSALGTWGILRPRPDSSTPSRTETLRRLAQNRRGQRTRVTDDDGGALDEDPTSPFVMLPPEPEAFGVRGEPLDFALAPIERTFLRKHLLGVRRPATGPRRCDQMAKRHVTVQLSVANQRCAACMLAEGHHARTSDGCGHAGGRSAGGCQKSSIRDHRHPAISAHCVANPSGADSAPASGHPFVGR